MSPGGGLETEAHPDRPDFTFPPSHRLRRREEFLRVQRRGRRVHTAHFVLVVLPREDGERLRRVGITVTKKVAKAVGRNRVKRVVREVFRTHRPLFPEGCDVVVIAKSGASLLGYADVLAEIRKVERALTAAARKKPLEPKGERAKRPKKR